MLLLRAAVFVACCCWATIATTPSGSNTEATTSTTTIINNNNNNNNNVWPLNLQPFFLSATNTALTPAQAQYISQFPAAVINHKQSAGDAPSGLHEERKQLDALAAIKRANASCTTLFYLNSLIDFDTLDLHLTFAAANGSWWLKDDGGKYILQHGGAYTFDWTVPEARQAWLAAAAAVMANSSIDGMFVDKAGTHIKAAGLNAARVAAWNAGHDELLAKLRRQAASADTVIVLNNRHGTGEGQLFERWGNHLDHDLLNITQDIAQLTANSEAGVVSLVRAGGATPGSGDAPDPRACAAGLAEMLVAVAAPHTAFFACALDFNSAHTWMSLLNESIYSLPLGAPVAARAERNGTTGLLTRRFSSGTVAVLDPSAANIGCVKWAGGETTGACPDY